MSIIPDFVDGYHLPIGEHICSLEEAEKRFARTETRTKRWSNFINMLKIMCELNLVPDAIIINGSFVTGRNEPGDVDFAALVSPQTLRNALDKSDSENKHGVLNFINPVNQTALRGLFGAHLLYADNQSMLDNWAYLFKKGKNGQLREPDPALDPEWVKRPSEKGILKVNKSDILTYIGGA